LVSRKLRSRGATDQGRAPFSSTHRLPTLHKQDCSLFPVVTDLRARGLLPGPPSAQGLVMISPPSAQEGTISRRLVRKSLSYNLLESKTRFIALAEGRVTGLLLSRISPETMPRLWPSVGFPRLGEPSNLSLAPETAELSDLLLLQPCTRPPWGLRRSLPVASP
jgi:hypothetical protein